MTDRGRDDPQTALDDVFDDAADERPDGEARAVAGAEGQGGNAGGGAGGGETAGAGGGETAGAGGGETAGAGGGETAGAGQRETAGAGGGAAGSPDVVDLEDRRYPDADDHVEFAVTQVDYTVRGRSDDEYPVVHVFGRTPERGLEHVEVHEFRPYFYAPTDSLDVPPEREYDRITDSRDTDEQGDPYESIRGEHLTKIFAQTPRDVGNLRDEFDHYEADILFPNRLLVDKDITSGVRVPERRTEDGVIHIPHDEIEPVEVSADARICTFDIEVDDRRGFPEDGEEPIVCLTSHDSYRDEYVAWLYNAPDGDVPPPEAVADHDLLDEGATVDIRAFETEPAMLEAFVDYVDQKTDADIMTGWNCLPADSEVLMADGTNEEIEDVDVGDKVVGSETQESVVAEVTNKWESRKEIYEFELADDTTLRSSGDHRVMVGDDEAVDWKRGSEIAPGDYVLRPRKLPVEQPQIPTLAELVPKENQRFTSEASIKEFKSRLPYGALIELSETSVPLDRELTEEELYLAGLVLADGTISKVDGVRFFNTRKELHDQFSGDGKLEPDGKGCYKQNVLDYATMYAFHGLGIPFGNKNEYAVDLSRVFEMPKPYVAQFLAGVIDGDGSIQASGIVVAAENRSIGKWYVKLFKRLGIYAQQNADLVRIPVAKRDVDRLKDYILPHMAHSEKAEQLSAFEGGKSGQTENIPYALFEAETGTDEKRIGRDKHRREINLERHETLSDEWEDYVFVEVEDVTRAGTEKTFDVETTTHDFIAEGCLVHNCDDFDAPYLIARLDELGLDSDRLSRVDEVWDGGWGGPDVKGRVVFDLLYAYKRTQFTELESYRLDAVAEEELGVGKERYTGDIGDLWEDDPDRLLEYNLRDVELCVELDRKQNIIPFWEEVATFVGCKLEDATTPGDAVDMYVLHKVHGDFVLPSKGKQEGEDYEGGAVFDPITGVREMVSVLDLRSLYPMVMVTINASPETKVDQDYQDETYRAPNGTEFRKHPDGIIREMVDELLAEREQKKGLRNEYDPNTDEYERFDRQQQAVKVIMNCFTPDTEVLTPDGIRRITDLDVGDSVYSLDPESMELEVKPVVETHAYPDYRGELVDIETDEIDFRVTPNHRMLVRKHDENGITEDEWDFVEAGDLHEDCRYEMPHDWEFDHGDRIDEVDLVDYVDGEYEVWVRPSGHGRTYIADACERSYVRREAGRTWIPRTYDGDDFLELLGWYITEGTVSTESKQSGRTPGGTSTTIQIARELVADGGDDHSRVGALLDRMGFEYYLDARSYQLTSELLGDALRSLCGAGRNGKRIPEFVFDLSERQKRRFLEILVAGDGDRKHNSWRYSTTSEQLRDDVLRLCAQLGLTASYRYDGDRWWISVTGEASNSFRMNRSGATSEAEDGVYCVTVEDNHTLLAGRNGKLQFVSQSLYGTLGWERFRLYDREMANAVTFTGQEVIKFTETAANELNKEVIYGDTDSVMLELGGDVSKEEAIEQSFEIEEYLNDRYDEFAREELDAHAHRFEIEFEKLYRRFFQAGKKKRYAGSKIWSEGKDVDDIEITGFEYKRSDIAPVTKEVQHEVIEMIVKGEDLDDVKSYLHEVIGDFLSGEVSLEEVGIPGGIGKHLDNYDTDTAQVRGAKYANLLLGTNFQRGSKPKRLYLEKVHPEFFRRVEAEKGLDPAEDPLYAEFKRDPDVICFEYPDQVPDEFEVDWEKMLDKTLRGPIARVLEALDVSWEEVKSGQEQTGLNKFM